MVLYTIPRDYTKCSHISGIKGTSWQPRWPSSLNWSIILFAQIRGSEHYGRTLKKPFFCAPKPLWSTCLLPAACSAGRATVLTPHLPPAWKGKSEDVTGRIWSIWRALWSTPFHSPASNIRPLSNKPLWQSHADPPNTHTPCHLDMNGRLTFRAVSTLRSSFIQISLLPPPCRLRCQQFFTDIISGCKWIWTV